MIGKRRLLASTAGFLAAGAAAGKGRAASYPSEPIKLVVPRAPGGGSDNLARLLSPGLEKKLGVSIIIDNRKDFTAVTMMAQGPVILIVHPDVPAQTLPELIALAKKTDLTYASGGVGASTHLVGVMLNLRAGTNIVHIPFKGSGPALNALLGGHVSMQFGGISSAAPYIKAGKVRAIALASDHRDPTLPDVPTFQEGGVTGADVASVWGLHAPPKTPIELRRVVRDAVAEVMREPELTKKLVEYGYEVVANTPEEHQAQTTALVTQWIEVGKKVNLKE